MTDKIHKLYKNVAQKIKPTHLQAFDLLLNSDTNTKRVVENWYAVAIKEFKYFIIINSNRKAIDVKKLIVIDTALTQRT